MTDQNAIQVISASIKAPGEMGQDSNAIVAKLMHKYPFFVPLRYIKAARQYREEGFSKELLTSIYPYKGNWILLYNYVQGDAAPPGIHIYVEAEDAPIDDLPNEVAQYEPENTQNIVGDEETDTQVAGEEDIEENKNREQIAEIKEFEHEPLTIAIEEMIFGIPDEDNKLDTDEDIAVIDDAVIRNETDKAKLEEPLFSLPSSEDYFMQQGVKMPGDVLIDLSSLTSSNENIKDKALMVVMSFTEWLLHFKNSSEKQKSEKEGQRAIKTMWQKEKLAAAIQEENEEIPEIVFEMAVNSITSEEGLASESLAEIYIKQLKYDRAIEMYRKLSLRNPQKNAYFAQKIRDITKEREL